MNDYKKMYHKLFNAVTESIEILQQAQQKAEEIYMSDEKTEQDNEDSPG